MNFFSTRTENYSKYGSDIQKIVIILPPFLRMVVDQLIVEVFP